jgi:hypothetical protein
MTYGYFFSGSTGGFYHSALHPDIPDDAVAVTDAEHEALLSAQEGGAEIIAGTDGAPQARLPQVDLGTLKANLSASIDAAAERERLKYITPGAGQAMTYQQKTGEAARYLAATDPVPADYPSLSAEIGITAGDIGGVAQVIVAAHAQWQIIGAAIEAARLGAKRAIGEADTEADAQAAAAAVTWPKTVAEG